MEGSKTIFGIFFEWWYREAFSRLLAYIKTFYSYLADFFSVMACLNTLFYPWKRDQVSYEGLGLKERFEAFMMNLVSRFVGAIVKLFALASFVVSTAALTAAAVIIIAAWYLYPAVILVLALASFLNA